MAYQSRSGGPGEKEAAGAAMRAHQREVETDVGRGGDAVATIARPPPAAVAVAVTTTSPTRVNTITRKPLGAITTHVAPLPAANTSPSTTMTTTTGTPSSTYEKQGGGLDDVVAYTETSRDRNLVGDVDTRLFGHGFDHARGYNDPSGGVPPAGANAAWRRPGQGRHALAMPRLIPAMKARFDRTVPPYRTYFGRRRRTCVIAVVAGVGLLIFVLGLGLGLGLKGKKSSSHRLPLPSSGTISSGDLTYYDPGLGACGMTSTSTQAICAISHLLFDAAQADASSSSSSSSSSSTNPNNNPLCGRRIRVARYRPDVGENRSVDVMVVDRCVGCRATDLDLSPAAFGALAEEAEGRVLGSWAWLP